RPAASTPAPATSAARARTAGPVLSREDVQLFRRTMKTVTPIKDTRRAVLPASPMAPGDILRQRRERAVGQDPVRLPQTSDHYHPAKVDSDDARYVRPGHGPDLIKGLKRGKWPIGASLDLHGSTLDDARERLDRFLQSCMAHQIKCVRIVHGKGYGSRDGEPVLKQTVRRWLTQLDSVIAYAECPEQDGGAGAVQVLLQK
ncbi:MAG: Smr/MutS family protein, partial [Pusillimonas sp.]